MSNALGIARASRVEPNRSAVELTFAKDAPNEEQVYKAVLTTLPLAPLGIQFEGDETGLALVRVAVAKSGATGGTSLLVRESKPNAAELRLVALEAGRYQILRPADGRRLVEDVEGFTVEGAQKVVARLEHIARWMRIAELRNPVGTLAGKFGFEIYLVTGDSVMDAKPVEGTSLRLLYGKDSTGEWRLRPAIKVKLSNRSDRPLYFSLVGLTETFAVQTGLLAGGSMRLEPGQEGWARDGKPIKTEVPDALWKSGVVEVRDVLKLIVCTEEFDPTLLAQGDLDHPLVSRAGGTRGVGAKSTLNRLLRHAQTRAFVDADEDEILSDWMTEEFAFTTVRPLESTAVPSRAEAELYPGVKLLSHPTLHARARLTAAPVASRDVAGGFVLPPLLRDAPDVSQPFLLSSSRGGAPGLSVLELFDVQNHEAVTPEQPLRLQIAQPLAADEHLLPVSHDGEFYLPIGRGVARDGYVEVVLDALPKPQNTRSLFGAVRIFFQKVISEHFGTAYEYPILGVFAPAGNGTAQVSAEPGEVRAKVAAASRIILYIHGIIGETRGMAASASGLAGPTPVQGLGGRYDLILTFDYENLHTSIEENARLLKERLIAAGLGPRHGKTLHIIAHSMGGLVSRWFIEREGGNEIVQHLVLLGTPNGGSPWPTVEDWAVAALSLGLNGLTAIAWPAKVLGSLVSVVEKIDVALDQMHPSSDFLKNLHASADPKVPYTIIAGNTSLISSATSPEKGNVIVRLLNRLRSQNLLHFATAPAFFGAPNDVAVSVPSICQLPSGRALPPKIREVPCDHLTYFSSPAGLQTLADNIP